MAVQEVEDTVVEDKPLAEMSVEELELSYEKQLEGETDSSEPDNDDQEIVAEVDEVVEEPKEVDDSNQVEAEKEVEMSASEKALLKQMEGIQKLLAKGETERGNFRKEMEAFRSKNLSEDVSEDDEIDPYVDPDKFFEKKLAEREQAQANTQQQFTERKSFIESKVPKFGDMVDSIADNLGSMLSDDPLVDTYKTNFKENPYILDDLTLLALGDNAKLRNELTELQDKISNSKNSKGDLIAKVNNLGRTRGVVSNGNNGSTSAGVKNQFTSRQIENMSLEDLEKQYKLDLQQQ